MKLSLIFMFAGLFTSNIADAYKGLFMQNMFDVYKSIMFEICLLDIKINGYESWMILG